LKAACEEAVARGLMASNPLASFEVGDMSEANYDGVDLHKHTVDSIVLAAKDGRPMYRESDLIDVWFDSGAMPYAQWHYPFENREKIDGGEAFPADFIAEGVDQTRGWFYTLHAIGTLVFDRVAYKSVLSNGLVLDKLGRKMSKRLGNTVDPFETLRTLGPDATRWYMMANAQPWENLRFDLEGIAEVQRKFATLHNTYGFLALYANIDGYRGSQGGGVPYARRPELDRWILSRLHSLIAEVDDAYTQLEPTRVARAIQTFAIDDLSNWFVRLSRRRFWKGSMNEDKASAYETLASCLRTLAVLGAPIAPFYMDRLYCDLAAGLPEDEERFAASVHLADFPVVRTEWIDVELERRMALAQQLSSLVLGLRKREKLRVRQPLRRIMVPALTEDFRTRLASIESWVLGEVNVKELQILKDGEGGIVKRIKPDFKALGPKCGKHMKEVAAALQQWGPAEISAFEATGRAQVSLPGGGEQVEVLLSEVAILTDDIPGWTVASEGGLTVALDVHIDEELRAEGLTRELVNRVQNLRKDAGLEVTDRIRLEVEAEEGVCRDLERNLTYLRTEVLADEVCWTAGLNAVPVDLGDGIQVGLMITKLN
jgi:isoleucyl-tRNA synthetase